MKVGDKAVLLPTKKRRRFVEIVGLNFLIAAPFADVVPVRANGKRKRVHLMDLQLPDALPPRQ